MKSYRILPSIITLCTFACALTAAQAGQRPDFRVNSDAGTAEQNWPRITLAPNHSFVIAWLDWRSTTSDIYLQRYDSTGAALGTNRKVNDESPASYQFAPSGATNSQGLVTLAWQDFRNGSYPFGADIFTQSYDADFNLGGTNRDATLEEPDSTHEAPDIVFGADDNGMLVWADYRNQNWDIYAQRITAAGTLIGGNIRVNDDQGAGAQSSPRIAAAPEGWYVVVWTDQRSATDDIYGQRFAADGSKLGANVRLTNDAGYRQAFPDVSVDLEGEITTAWVDWRNGIYPANPDIYYSRHTSNWTIEENNVRANADLSSRAQRDPAVASDIFGNTAILWSDSTTATTDPWDLTGQLIGPDGNKAGGTFHPHITTDGNQLRADVALDGKYRYTTWVDSRNGNYDIYASITEYNTPGLAVSRSALQFVIDSAGKIPPSQTFTVTNSGYGTLSFSVSQNASWLSVSPASGQTPSTVTCSIQPNGLGDGTYSTIVSLVNPDNGDVQAAVTVTLVVSTTAPLLALTPATTIINTDQPAAINLPLALQSNLASTAWKASAQSAWLTVSPTSGSGSDTLQVGTTNIPDWPGLYVDTVTVRDTMTNLTARSVLYCNYFSPSNDTVRIGDLSVGTGESGGIPVSVALTENITRMRLYIAYDGQYLIPRSFTKSATLPSNIGTTLSIDSVHQRTKLELTVVPGSQLTAGSWVIGDLQIEAKLAQGESQITPITYDTLYTDLFREDGRRVAPVVIAGDANVDSPTPVVNDNAPVLPSEFSLAQNYPNPFNLTTTIRFSLPSRGHCRLDLYNILGSRVATLVDADLAAGEHAAEWDGLLESGRTAPSGFYFYRLETDLGKLVRKMILLK